MISLTNFLNVPLFLWLEESCEAEHPLLDPQLIESHQLRVDWILHQVSHWPHGQDLSRAFVPKQIGEDALEPTYTLLSSVAPAQEVGQEDEVILLGRANKTRLLEQGSEAEKDGGAEASVQWKALNQQVLALLQFSDRLHDG